MKKLCSILVLAWLGVHCVSAQIDTTGGRYYKPVFSNVTVTRGVVYGSAAPLASSTAQALLMDVYQPAGDTVGRRPVIILAHDGAFLTGTRDDQPMTELCTRFARLGYVTASIDYRLLSFLQVLLPRDTINLAKGAILAAQDIRAAVRFFRNDAATTRQYRVSSRYIFAGGSSAGGIAGLQMGYLDKVSEVPGYYDISSLGGVEGTGGNAGYPSTALAIINLSGALGRREFLEPGSLPLVSVHGTADPSVPYDFGRPGFNLPPQRLYGSKAIKTRADAVGVQNNFYSFKGAGHAPYNGTSQADMAYMDTTFRFVRDFLRPFLGRSGTIVTATTRAEPAVAVQVYPVPATDVVHLVAPVASFRPREVELLDAMGRVVRRFRWQQPKQVLARETLKAGVYVLRGEGLAVQRILFE
jgi:acetyl esterase/lipase